MFILFVNWDFLKLDVFLWDFIIIFFSYFSGLSSKLADERWIIWNYSLLHWYLIYFPSSIFGIILPFFFFFFFYVEIL